MKMIDDELRAIKINNICPTIDATYLTTGDTYAKPLKVSQSKKEIKLLKLLASNFVATK